jgi:hypothetical protein
MVEDRNSQTLAACDVGSGIAVRILRENVLEKSDK